MHLKKVNSNHFNNDKSPMLRDKSVSSSDPFASSEDLSPQHEGKLDDSPQKKEPRLYLDWNDLEEEKDPDKVHLERYDSAL